MIKFALTIVIGGIIGAAIGIAMPILLAIYYSITDPAGGGVYTVYLLVCTVPGGAALGVIIGAIVGAFRD